MTAKTPSPIWHADGTARIKTVVTLAVDLDQWSEAYGLDDLTDRQVRDHVRDHAAFTLDAALAAEANGARVRDPRAGRE